jgi:1-acyl-sn-glycerol-3-phosphate acyltransferase
MYESLVAIVRFIVVLFWGLDIEGTEHIPEKSGAIVAGNHSSWSDPLVLAAAIRRPLHFMAKAELFKKPALAWLFSSINAFPVHREQADRQAIRTSQDKVSAGHLLGMFPEGTRNKTEGDLLPLKGGVALIAIKSGVPVIPVMVSQGKRRGLRRPFRVTIGAPIDLGGPKKASKKDIARGSEVISVQFRSLLSRNN